jgi:hypothetical protein
MKHMTMLSNNGLGHALTLCALAVGILQASAQDDTIPLVQDVRTLQMQLKTIGQEVTVKYAVDGNRIFYFPVFLLREVKLPDGRPATDPQGNLRVSSGDGLLNLTVTLLDLWKSRAYQDDLICTLTNHPVIRSLTSVPQLLPAATTGDRRATLLLTDPNLGNQRFVLAESLLSDLSDAEYQVTAQFVLDARARALVTGFVGGLPIQARHLAVQVEQSYRARYTTTLALINLQSAVESMSVMRQSLLSAPDRGRPTLLLSPNLPQPNLPEGSALLDRNFTEQVRRFVRLQVLTREGASVDPQLVDRLVNAALEQAALALRVSDDERQNAVASILLEDGLTMSLALNEINQLDAALHSNQESQYRSALINSATKSQNTEVRGSAGVSFGPFGGSASAETKQNWSRSDYVNRRMEDIKRQVRDASVRLSGTVRTLTGIRFSQSGTVENVSFTSIEQTIGTFTVGDATILNTRSAQEYAILLGTAQQVEALRVQQVETGSESTVGSDGWQDNQQGWTIYKDIPIVFSKPFAGTPTVTVSMQVANWAQTSSPQMFLSVFALNITNTGFTLRLAAARSNPIYWSGATWIAVGERSVRHGQTTSLGTPGLPPLIPAEARQAVLTPQLLPAPQLVNGEFQAAFNAIPGRTYQVESSATMQPGEWSALGTVTASDFLAAFALPVDTSDPHRFFRVRTP